MCRRENGRENGATATVDVIEDGARVRIVRFTLTPGAETGWHTHALDYIIVPYDDCKVRVDRRTGSVEAEMFRHAPYFRQKGVEHDVINANDGEYAFIEIELK